MGGMMRICVYNQLKLMPRIWYDLAIDAIKMIYSIFEEVTRDWVGDSGCWIQTKMENLFSVKRFPFAL